MRVFLTGSTGYIGSRIVPEPIDGAHQVLGLARSGAGARWVEQHGADAHGGTLDAPALDRSRPA
jgi:nucleoside-diphosphate-sugar epimerase